MENEPLARLDRLRRRERFLAWVLAIAFVCALLLGVLFQAQLHNETTDRVAGECRTLQQSLAPIRKIILFATQPADLRGLAPDRRAIGEATNAARARARAEVLPLIPTPHCKP